MASTGTRARARTRIRLVPTAAAGLAALLTLGLALPADAGASAPTTTGAPTTPDPRRDLRAATSDAAVAGLDALDARAADPVAAAAVEPRMETYETSRPVAPGVTLRSFDRYGPDAFSGTPTWLQADSLTVDLGRGTTPGYLFPGQVAKGEPISVQANRVGAVAAVNGDFFDINNSTAPLGVGVKDGTVVQSPDADPTWRRSAAILTPDGLGRIGEVLFEGTIALPGGESAPLAGINKPSLPVDGIEAFTPLWGTYCRCRATDGAAKVTEVEVVDGQVTAVRPAAGEGAVPADGFVLVGREAGANVLAELAVGDPVTISYRARTADDQEIRTAVNGRQLLVVNGVAQKASQGNNVPPAPRTAVGFSEDGRKMFVLTADGRQPAFADGLGLDELAAMMIELGAFNAVNLDGGGSTTMVARTPGGTTARGGEPSLGRRRTTRSQRAGVVRAEGQRHAARTVGRDGARARPRARLVDGGAGPARPRVPRPDPTPHGGRLRRDVRPRGKRSALAYQLGAARHGQRRRRFRGPRARDGDRDRPRRRDQRHEAAAGAASARADRRHQRAARPCGQRRTHHVRRRRLRRRRLPGTDRAGRPHAVVRPRARRHRSRDRRPVHRHGPPAARLDPRRASRRRQAGGHSPSRSAWTRRWSRTSRTRRRGATSANAATGAIAPAPGKVGQGLATRVQLRRVDRHPYRRGTRRRRHRGAGPAPRAAPVGQLLRPRRVGEHPGVRRHRGAAAGVPRGLPHHDGMAAADASPCHRERSTR